MMASEQKIRINALKHEGLSKNDMELKAKVLSVPVWFADKWQLEKHNVTNPSRRTQVLTYTQGHGRSYKW